MTNLSDDLKPPMKTLRRKRALFFLLLRTAAATAILLFCGLYYLKEVFIPDLGKKPPPREKITIPRSTAAPALIAAKPVREARPADPLALVKSRSAAAPKPAATPIPRLKTATFGGSGGQFAPARPDYAGAADGGAEPAAPRRDYSGEAVLLSPAALDKKFKVKGLAPVPPSTAKKYSGTDKEAEKLREALRVKAEAAAAEKARLRREKIILGALLLPVFLLVILVGSRVLKALRLLEKPEGSHWTLK